MAVRLAQDRAKKAAADAKASGGDQLGGAGGGAGPPIVVLCGPSGVGKSTMIAKLLEEDSSRFGFSVSCTTRPPRAGEVDGVDYDFLSVDRFDRMLENDEFVEWASVGGERYGTSVAGVQSVSASGKVCLMDLDVQGVESLASRDDLSTFCVWIAPPSLDALRARLRARGTETSEQIEARIARATSEIEYSLQARCFDKIILNEDLDDAFAALKSALDERLAS
jgi:guanylate kinase